MVGNIHLRLRVSKYQVILGNNIENNAPDLCNIVIVADGKDVLYPAQLADRAVDNAVGSQLGIRNLYHLIVERPNGCEKNADTLDISLKASELYQISRRKRLCHKQNNSADKIAQRVLERKARRYSRGADCGNNRVDLYADIRQRDKHDYRIQRDLDKRKGEGLYRVIYLCFEQDFFDRNKYQLDRDYTDGNNYQKDQKL